MLALHHFTQLDGASPKEWLVYQLTRDLHIITTSIYFSLVQQDRTFLMALRTALEHRFMRLE